MARFEFKRLNPNAGDDGRRVPSENGQRTEARTKRVIAHGERGDGDKVMIDDGVDVKIKTKPKART